MNRKSLLFASILLLYFIFFMPVFEWSLIVKAIVCLVIIQLLWMGGVFPLAFSSVLLMLLLSFHFFTFQETLSFFGTEIVWLLFSTFILANAFIRSGLASRISLKLLSLSKGSGKLLLLFSFLLMFVLSVFIPSNVGKGSLVASVLDGIVKNLKEVSRVDNLAKSLFIGLSYVIAISGAAVATGASSTIFAFGIISQLSPSINYVSWMLFLGVPIVAFVVLLWILFLSAFPPEEIDRRLVRQMINEKLEQLGKFSVAESKMLGIIVIILLLWMTESFHGYSIALVALLGAALTVLPYTGIWQWEDAREKVDWDMLLFFAATLMLSQMLISTGTVKWFASLLTNGMDSGSFFGVVLILVLTVALLRLAFVNVLGFLTIILPVAVTVGESFSNDSALLIAMAVFLTGIPGFILVTQSPIHLISYSYGHFAKADLLKVGVMSTVLWLFVIFISIYFYWQLLL